MGSLTTYDTWHDERRKPQLYSWICTSHPLTNLHNLSMESMICSEKNTHTQTIKHTSCFPILHTMHVWYIYLHEWLIFMVNAGKNKYTNGGYGFNNVEFSAIKIEPTYFQKEKRSISFSWPCKLAVLTSA